ncbi:MAG: aminotransferase class I/II-fold pyridoxal phosphate-dependent enzyme [Lachnospiraceae bacterium]|nr:aminotransferase class I/II-fold pyridoxal phosphate-dependent enzyme [Lachnospiraceae bacterium]
MQAAKRMKELEGGIFQLLNEKKNEVEAQGRKVFNLSVGTPDFPPAPHVMEAVAKAAMQPENYKYALTDLPELTKAVQQRFTDRYGVNLSEEEIMSVYGSQEGIAHIGLTLFDEGDIVLVPDPGYPIFSIGPFLAGARIEKYELLPERDYLPNLPVLEKAYGHRAKAMIVSYPLNPICKCAPKSFYEELIPWAMRNDIVIIHDNAYSDIIYDGREGDSILSIPGAKEVCVEFYSLSKSYNYTGARMGFLVGNKEVIANFNKLRSQIDYGTFLPVQYGAIAALTGSDDYVKEQCRKYEERRNALCDGLTALGWKVERSEGTMFAWAKIPEGFSDDTDFVMTLLERTGLLVTPGSSFGEKGKGYVRFALTLPVEAIQEAVEAVKKSGILKR